MNNVAEYWEAVQLRVCGHCIDGNRKGACRLDSDTECGLRQHFSDIVDTILSVKSDSFGPYERALRERVCSVCEHQSAGGTCHTRDQIECGLDRYFPMVVETIEGLRMNRSGEQVNVEGYR